ncbi:MAG: alpha/beta hydrolase, partial [Oscillospiraceae bacterium]|nr:alpha/beta hydrolase [Oscillospiraceae bacterium]
MIHQVIPASVFAPRLTGSQATLKTYARPQEGFLAEQGGRWGVLILPGGGYQVNAVSEGEPVALAFLGQGVQAFLLEYSVAPARWPQALLEAAAAVAWMRDNAAGYGLAPDRIAVCGFSAGGHLAGCVANLWGSPTVTAPLGLTGRQARPDAAVLCYPVITMDVPSGTRDTLFPEGAAAPEASLETSVGEENPPCFLWATATDASVPVKNSLLYADALNLKGIPYELHIFSKGPHAMGLATGDSALQADHTDRRASAWHGMCVDWL